MKTFEERYPEHDNPDWQIRTWRQEEELEKAKAEHRNYVQVDASYEQNDPPIKTWRQEEKLQQAKSEHEDFIRKFNDLLIG